MSSWKDNLRKIEPYIPGEQPNSKNSIKLNANENPYPPSPETIKAIKSFDLDTLRIYPDSSARDFKFAIASYYNVNCKNIFIGNGSDDVLAFCFQGLFNKDRGILFPDITYSFYPVWCKLFGIKYKLCPLDGNFRIDLNDYKQPNGGIVIPNPNAPTSIGESRSFIQHLLDNNKDSVVVIDEAYVDFGGESAIPLTKEYDNLLITGTFSKSRSLAGLRIGYAIGSPLLITTLENIKNSYNSYTVDSISMAAGTASLSDEKYFKNTISKIIKTRNATILELRKMGFKVFDSKTNFLFVTHDNLNMKDYYNYLKSKNIFIRYFDKPRIENYVRITTGTDSQMYALLDATENYLNRILN